ncbi:MAG: cytochrome oxidase [Deltaproteobacteria bacterium]|nr:cytochrome oxidase [Deltaproteobacteria bacterium]
MNAIPLMVFVSLMLVCGSLILFGYSVRHRDHQQAERLALLPFADEETPTTREQP